jgi:hypothetical protein
MKKNKKAKFSIPYNPFLDKEELIQFISFLKENKDNIFDVYTTSYLPPFTKDAMGINSLEINSQIIVNAYIIQSETGIPVSLTFNNFCVSPSYENYKEFILNLKQLKKFYTLTIPHTSWLKFGLREEMKKFVENSDKILIKNTILWKLKDPSEIYKQFEAGFDYINLDRTLLRNVDLIKEIDEARKIAEKKFGKKLYLSLLINEGCEGNCPIQNDHFIYNNNREKNEPTFFNSDLRKISCEKFDNENPKLYKLKSANIIQDFREIDYYSQWIDSFKLHGRENKNVFYSSLKLIENYKNNEIDIGIKSILMDKYDEYRNFVRNCKFKCYKCNYCEEVIQKNNFKKIKLNLKGE